MPKISVIVPVYNVENKIRRCIDSILSQTFTDYELILIDDGSPDKSGDICDEYSKMYDWIRVIHQENKGVSAARNRGVVESKGKFICFVDSDDYLEPEYLLVLFYGIKQTQLSICGVYTCHDGINEKSSQKHYDDFCFELLNNTGIIAELIRDRRFNYVYSKLFLREVIVNNKIKFDDEITLGEDTVFVFDYIKRIKSVSIIGNCYYNYIRYDSNSLTAVFWDDFFTKFTFINDYIENTLIEMGLLDQVTLRAIDERRIISSTWVIDSIMTNRNLSLRKRKSLLYTVFIDDSLIAAINRIPEINENYRYCTYICKNKPTRFMIFYYFCQRKEKTIQCFKAIIVKFLPRGFIVKVKKWLQIVQ